MRTIVRQCAHCDGRLEIQRPKGSRGRLPKMHKHCSVESNRQKSRETQRKVRAGEHVPQWRPSAPLWDEAEHNGPGARKAITSAQGWGMAHIDFPWLDDAPRADALELTQAEALEAVSVPLRDAQGHGTPSLRPRKGPVPTGDSHADALGRVLRSQEAGKGWGTPQGPSEGRTALVPYAGLDDESRAWLEAHPNWWEGPRPGPDGGWGLAPSTTPVARDPEPGDDWRRSMLDGRPVSLDDWPRPEPIHRVYDLTSRVAPVWPDARVKALVCHQKGFS